jgi:hypothetical protein
VTMQAAILELQRKARQKLQRLARLRRDPRYLAVLGAFTHAKLLSTNVDVQPKKGPVALKDVLWAGKLEPRFLELLPAVMIKKPSMIEHDGVPTDLAEVVDQLRRNETPTAFRGIPGEKLQEWVPRIGHKGKLPTQLKAFRFRKEDVDLLVEIAKERGLTETDVICAGSLYTLQCVIFHTWQQISQLMMTFWTKP